MKIIEKKEGRGANWAYLTYLRRSSTVPQSIHRKTHRLLLPDLSTFLAVYLASLSSSLPLSHT